MDGSSRKRTRPGTAHELSEEATVRISGVPSEYTPDIVEELLESLEIDAAALADLVSVKLLAPARASNGATRTIMITLNTQESAQTVAAALHGQEVETTSGDVTSLVAELYRVQKSEQRGLPQRGDAVAPTSVEAAAGILPSVYLADVPLGYTEDSMRELHEYVGLDVDSVVSMKFLPAKGEYAEAGCCIVRYRDAESADAAVAAMQGCPVQVMSGATKFIGARMAKPAGWMEERMEELQRNEGAQRLSQHKGKGAKAAAREDADADAKEDEPDPQSAQYDSSEFLVPTPKWAPAPARGRLVVKPVANAKNAAPQRSAQPVAAPTSARAAPVAVAFKTVKLSSVPEGYTHEILAELLASCGVDPSILISSKFLLPAPGSIVVTRTVLLHLDSEASGPGVVAALHGQEVECASGEVKCLVARPYNPIAEEFGVAVGGKAIGSGPSGGILPSVYLADVPVSYTEAMVREMHASVGLEPEDVISVKFLPSKATFGETGACIVRYANEASAHIAVQALQGHPVTTPSGQRKYIGARMAKPAGWMKERGVADAQEANYKSARGRQ